MNIFEGYPLRKILKREQALMWLLSPIALQLILGIIVPILLLATNADAVASLSQAELLEAMEPVLNVVGSVASILPLFILPLIILGRKIPLINRKQLSREDWKVIPGLNTQDWKFLAWYIPVSFILLNIGSTLLSMVFENSEAINQEAIEELVGVTPAWVMFLMVVIAAPIVEEWLFRGLILFRRDSLDASWISVIVSSIIFGAFHVPTNIPSAFTYIGMGFMFAYAAKRTKSVEASIFYHMLNNSIAFIALYAVV
ncbi:CPBP family intramembrane glutamic endopeptidase [Marinilactibacillus sp. Marseille-P9653]|uniref:CPBP family intramembrane glutamic endopeptidase n=1 Tax=Marinilactibacillus sp. Marseille-P9653 TaxID=2866583 RepID=UPI001CE4B189|nr:type II CAAX endopeptidase family protein [Marinilactibacillus sp. Marseille-P9653]